MENNYRSQFKTFIKACEIFNQDRKKFKKYMSEDKRISHGERNLLKAMYHIKRGNLKESLDILDHTTLNHDFLQAYQYYLKGLLYNNFCDSPKSVQALSKSIELYEKLDDDYFLFLPLKTAVITLGNMRETKTLKQMFNKFEAIPRKDKIRKAQFNFAKSYYLFVHGKIDESLKTISHIQQHYQDELGHIMAFVLVIKFLNRFKLKNYDECGEILKEYKLTKGYHIKSNYKFMTTLLKHICNDSPIYVYQKDFKDVPELHFQIETIKCLANLEFDEAKCWYHKLRKLNPNLYGDDFQYNGSYCLFSAALAKHLDKKIDKNIINFEELNSIKTAAKKILFLLENSETPISKEQIIELVWNEEIDEIYFNRLKTTISRLRSKYDLDIQVNNGHYSLKKAA